MFRWILKGMLFLWIVTAGSLVMADTFGSIQHNTILNLITSDGGNSQSNQRHLLVDLPTGLSYEMDFPLSEDTVARISSWFPFGSREFLITTARIVNPDEDRLSRRRTQYGVYQYDFFQRRMIPYMVYTRSWSREARTLDQLTNNILRLTYPDTSMSDQPERVAIYHVNLNKIFIFDPVDENRHLHTIHVGGNLGAGHPDIAWSPDGQQFAMRYRPGVLMLINVDGTNRRYYAVDGYRHFDVMWSQDGREILIHQYIDSEVTSLKILDVESGEWRSDIERIVGRSPRWICNDKWLTYVTSEADVIPPEIHMMHMETGRIIHLTNHPALNEIENLRSIGTTNCQHFFITSNFNEDPGQPLQLGNRRYTLHIADFDLGLIQLVQEEIFADSYSSFDEKSITYQAAFDDQYHALYRQSLEGGSPEITGYVPIDTPYLWLTYDNNRYGVYMDREVSGGTSYGAPRPNNLVYVLDTATGERDLAVKTQDVIWGLFLLYDD